MTPLPAIKNKVLLITRGGEGVSTPKAYGMIDELYGENVNMRHGNYSEAVSSVESGNFSSLIANGYNIFEEVILPMHSTAKRQKDILTECGADFCMMSGSGPAVFAFFKDMARANNAASEIRKIGARAFVCRTI